MRGLGQLFFTNFKLFLREPIGTFFTLAFPSLLIVLFGAMYGNEPDPLFGGYGSMDISMPGYTSLILGTVGFMSVPIALSGYRETGVLRRYQASALRPITYIIADVLANLLMTLLGMVILVLVGWLLHRVRFEGNPLQLIAGVILSGLSMFSAGYLIASVARGARTAQIVGMVILYPMMFLSGAGMPIELLPDTIRRISDFLPLTYVVRLLRALWFGESWGDYLLETAVLCGILIICTVIAARFFKWE
jgi:ABC-2 type transport system permease protein